MGILNKNQIDFFNREGYLVLKNIYTEKEINHLRAHFGNEFQAGFWKKSKYNSENIINDIYNSHPFLVELIFKNKLIESLKSILGNELVCIPECCIHKNRYFDWHTDWSVVLGDHPEANSRKILNDYTHLQCAIYLQENSPLGGGLTVIKRSHKNCSNFNTIYTQRPINKLIQKILKNTKLSLFNRLDRNKNAIRIEQKVGDVLLFNGKISLPF